MADDAVIPVDVDFLYKEREAGKRRVKPVAAKYTQLFTNLDNDESDVEFECPDSNSAYTDSSEDGGATTSNDSSEEDVTEVSPETNNKPEAETDEILQMDLNPIIDILKVCSVCLKTDNSDENEIIQCDNCAIQVHEMCYGVPDTSSLDSDASSASTEPWFCDACKAGVEPHCELCPNEFGIFKKAENGKLVHLICAFYVKGVQFRNTDTFSPVVLSGLQNSRFGARNCGLCEDKRLARSGICVICEAGMCKRSYHVTCAQREGLLLEDNSVNDSKHDPFYLYCFQHNKNEERHSQKKNFTLSLTLQKSDKKKLVEIDETSKKRMIKYLQSHREKFDSDEKTRFDLDRDSYKSESGKSAPKGSRSVTTCPYAVKMLLKKAKASGWETSGNELREANAPRQLTVTPALSGNFATYFFDREAVIANLKDDKTKNEKKCHKLEKEISELEDKRDECKKMKEQIINELVNIKNNGYLLYSYLQKLQPQIRIPYYLQPTIATPRITNGSGSPPKKLGIQSKMSTYSEENNFKKGRLPKDSKISGEECRTCKKRANKPSSVKCDRCLNVYHFKCLDPPLKRSPKQPGYGWHCTNCDSSDSEEDNENSRKKRKVTLRASKYPSDDFVTCLWEDD